MKNGIFYYRDELRIQNCSLKIEKLAV